MLLSVLIVCGGINNKELTWKSGKILNSDGGGGREGGGLGVMTLVHKHQKPHRKQALFLT